MSAAKMPTTIDDILNPGERTRRELDALNAAMARIDEERACLVAPASYESVAPYTVGAKGGFLSWRAAIIAGREQDMPVIDAAGVCIWAPRGQR